MEAILLLASTPEEAYKAVSYICEDIKACQEANHQLYFARIMFGAFHISKGAVESTEIAPGVIQKDSKLTGVHELIIFPSSNEEHIEKLKTDKTIVMVKNCMCMAGPSDKKQQLRQYIIKWLLDDDLRWDYSNVDLTE